MQPCDEVGAHVTRVPHVRTRTLVDMSAELTPGLYGRLHVDLQRVSSAICSPA
jgi:hypothetical protein